MNRKSFRGLAIALGIVLAVMGTMAKAHAADDIGIFERILDASGSWDDTVSAFEKGLGESKLVLHSKFDLKIPNGIQKARVYVLTSPTYQAAAAGMSPDTISAQILRVNIYQYAEGKKTFIDITNPVAHAMVFYSGTTQYAKLVEAAKAAAQEIKDVAAKVPGKVVTAQLEPTRSEKSLNKFNGDGPAKMMALFRNWKKSQNVIFEDTPGNFAAAVAKVENSLKTSQDKGVEDSSGWRMITKIPIGDNAVYFGITNDYTENKCITINSDFRSDGKTKDAPYPGVDHGPALPLEVIAYTDGKNTRVVQYGEMWRMQLYFWDSGYLAFAKNTLIPSIIFGSIEKSIK